MVCWKAESLNSVLSFVLSPFLTSTRWLKGGLQKVRSRKLAAATASATIMWKLFCESEKKKSSKWSGLLLLFLGAWSMEPMASSGGPVQQQDGQPSNEDDHATRLVFFFISGAFLCLFWRIFNGFIGHQMSKSITFDQRIRQSKAGWVFDFWRLSLFILTHF